MLTGSQQSQQEDQLTKFDCRAKRIAGLPAQRAF